VRVLYFGTYERHYPRNAQVISSLRRAGVDVVERHVPVWESSEHKFGLGPRAALDLLRAQVILLRRPVEDFDVLIVGYPGHFDLGRARRVARGRPIVFNPMLSLYDSIVHDRGRWSDRSPQARLLRAIDRRSMRLADVVVADTDVHADYFAALAGIPRDRVEVCFLGAEEPLFSPGWEPEGAFGCLFYGKLIPLHGLDTILAAARLAPEIPFRIAGAGQLEGLLEHGLPPNVEWVRWVAHEQIPRELRSAGCALGIFGTTDKASRVIPNKAFEALACGTPLVTSDTVASRELLVDGESALLVPPGDPTALASALRRLAAEPALRRRIAEGGLRVYRERASEDVLGARWRTIVERVTASGRGSRAPRSPR
jgi:glycosyltransferase involved in cell wall biosynthesis